MRVAILGCGYVGLELGRQLRDDHEVVGVRRSPDGLDAIEAAGLEAVQADVTDRDSLAAVPDVDAVVFAASSGGRGPGPAREVYVEGQRTVIDEFAARERPPDRYVYTSSTGVYGDHGGDWVDERTEPTPDSERGEVLLAAERVALEESTGAGIDGTVARLAGIYGPDRYRIDRYLDGPVVEGYRNTIHRDDAAGAVRFLLAEDVAREAVVLVVDDEPVSRWAFADWLADACGRADPRTLTVEEYLAERDVSAGRRRRLTTDKRCSNDRLRDLGYDLRYPTFREGYREAIARHPAGDE
jgi:nucleoside-diphosphate-sugar epimerase